MRLFGINLAVLLLVSLQCQALKAQPFSLGDGRFAVTPSAQLQEPTPPDVATPFRWIHLMVDCDIPTPGSVSVGDDLPFKFTSDIYGYPYWCWTVPRRIYWERMAKGIWYTNIGYQF